MDFSGIDLKALSEKGADCHISHPVTGAKLYQDDGKPITIKVLGQDSEAFRKAVAKNIGEAEEGASLEAREARAVSLLVDLVVSWSGIEWNEEPLKCTKDNVQMFLTKFPPIRSQLDAFVAKRSNFS